MNAEKEASLIVDRYYDSLAGSPPCKMRPTNRMPLPFEYDPVADGAAVAASSPWASSRFYVSAPRDVQQITAQLERSRPKCSPRKRTLRSDAPQQMLNADLSLLLEENVLMEASNPSHWHRMDFGSRSSAIDFAARQESTYARLLQEVEASTAHTPDEAQTLSNTALLFDAVGDVHSRERMETLFREKHVDPNLKMPWGNHLTVLAHAAQHGDVEAVGVLLEHKADPSLRCGQRSEGLLPLQVAFQHNQVEACNVLIKEMHDVNWAPPMKDAGDHWDILFSSITGRLKTLGRALHESEDVESMQPQMRECEQPGVRV